MIIPHHDKSRKRKKKNLTKKLSILNAYINFKLSKVSNSRVNNVGSNIMVVKELLTYDKDIEKAIEKIAETQKYIETMNSWYDVTLGSIRRDKRTMKYNDINSLIASQMNLWKKVLKSQNIDIISQV